MITAYRLEKSGPAPLDIANSEDALDRVAEALAPSGNKEAVQPHWLDLSAATQEECMRVAAHFSLPPEHLLAALDVNERPRAEYEDGILLIVARTPHHNKNAKHKCFCTEPIAVVLVPGLVITVCLKPELATVMLCRRLLGSGPNLAERLVLTLLLRISTTFIEQLRQMDEQVEAMERTLHSSMQNQELLKMLQVEKALIYFLTALKGNHSVMEKIRSGSPLAVTPEDRNLLDDVIIENKQATDMAEIFTLIMGSLSDAFGAIVSNNLNKVMKVLTGLTIVFMIPSIIGALYGMNVALPWQESPLAFAALCALCLGLSFAVFYVLRKKDWI